MRSPAGANTIERACQRPIDGSSALLSGEIGTGLLAAVERIEAEAIVRLVEFDAANLTAFLGYASAVRHIEVEAGVSKTDAIRLHRLVTHCRRFPLTGAALETGLITVPYLQELAAAAHGLAKQYEADEADLIGMADGRDVGTFTRRLSNWRFRHLDRHKETEERFNERHLTTQRRLDGSGRGTFSLDPIGMDIVETALDTKPDPATSTSPCRSLKQRRADKLVALLAGESEPGCSLVPTGSLNPTGRIEGTSTTVDVVIDLTAIDSAAIDSAAIERMQAAVESIRSEFASGSPISKPVLDQLLCDASYRRVLTDGPSQVLDIGAPTRQIPVPLRRAIQIRDQHCQFAGCDTQWSWCDVHHLKPISQGGHTSERNLTLVCRFHHSLIHQAGWVLQRDPTTGELHTHSP